MSGKGQIVFTGVSKNRLINGRKPAPVTDTESPQIPSGRKNYVPGAGDSRAVGKEGIIAGEIAFLQIVCGDAASKAVIKMKELFQTK